MLQKVISKHFIINCKEAYIFNNVESGGKSKSRKYFMIKNFRIKNSPLCNINVIKNVWTEEL